MAQAQSNPPSAIGRRKSSTARVILFPGKGNVSVNGRQISDYLSRETLVNHACEPLLATESTGRFDIVCTAKGGGVSGQAGAIRLASAHSAAAVFLPATRAKLNEKNTGVPKLANASSIRSDKKQEVSTLSRIFC